MSNEPFKGKGNDRSPFTEDENAAHREMFKKVSNAWPSIDGLDNLSKGGAQLVKIVSVLGVIGAAIAYIVKVGLV